MADITPTAGDYLRPHSSPWGSPHIRTMALSTGISSNIIYIGTVVGLDVNSTQFRNCVSPSSLTSNTVVSTAIVGIAAEGPGASATSPSSTNIQGTLIPVWDANPSIEFRGRTRNGLLNSTIVGEVKDILWDSTLHIHLINVGASSLSAPAPRVLITGLLDNSGDSGGLVTFKFLQKDVTSSLSTNSLLAFWK